MSRVVNIKDVSQREVKRYVNKKHIEWLHSFACFVCGRRPVEVHHTLDPKDTSRGTSRKAGDHEAVPLCPEHHRQVHRGRKSWRMKYGAREEEVMRGLWNRSPFNPANGS